MAREVKQASKDTGLTIEVDEDTYTISSDNEIFATITFQDDSYREVNGATVESLLAVLLDHLTS
jgi:hypothetical protein